MAEKDVVAREVEKAVREIKEPIVKEAGHTGENRNPPEKAVHDKDHPKPDIL
jgi:hypothetical protein